MQAGFVKQTTFSAINLTAPAIALITAVSAVLAFSRSFLFTVASIQIMPVLLGGVTGVWLATPVAELLGTAMAAALLLRYRKRYGY